MARTDRDIIDSYLRRNPPIPPLDVLLQKLRPLVWEELGDVWPMAFVDTPLGYYEVISHLDNRWNWRYDHGKHLCQLDYQSRVRALFE